MITDPLRYIASRYQSVCTAALLLVVGCGTAPGVDASPSDGSAAGGEVTATVINVTLFDVTALLSGIRNDDVDTVERSAGSQDTAAVTFRCIDELVVGDPLNPELPGVIIDPDGLAALVDPFSILEGESFFCGDIIEIIVSGNDIETFAVDVFAFTPP